MVKGVIDFENKWDFNTDYAISFVSHTVWLLYNLSLIKFVFDFVFVSVTNGVGHSSRGIETILCEVTAEDPEKCSARQIGLSVSEILLHIFDAWCLGSRKIWI